MTNIAWNLIKLDAKKILCNITESNIIERNGNYDVVFKYDLSDKNPADRDIILSEDTYADNALFFQLGKILTADLTLGIDENFMRSTLLFVDFKDLFKKDRSTVKLPIERPPKKVLLKEEALLYRMQLLFKDGLYLSFDGKNFKQFVPFDKSSSMSRSCQITFIDSQIKSILDKRLMLDMNFLGEDMELSKFYAYRGLYLSSAYRIEIDQKFSLNAETVVVLDDRVETLKQIPTFTAFKNDKLWEYATDKRDLKLNLFDGEGLISPGLAEYISNFLQSEYKFHKPSHSFQIRMPFTKGVLHEVDFNNFFSEQLQAVEADELLIEDYFGITRDLRKAKIILTKSMFKCARWMKNLKDCMLDPMKIFFEKFAEYEHALYVVGTEARLFNAGHIRLNYQFLSTLALSVEDFNSMVADHRAIIDSFAERFSSSLSATFAFDCDERNDMDLNDESTSEEIIVRSSFDRTTCLKAAAKNPAFLRDYKVKSISEDMKKNYECDLGLGRLEVEGEQRFLSCDLLAFLIKTLAKIKNFKPDDDAIKLLKRECLYQDRFFMPNNTLSIKPDKHYVFLRSPHLSRNEQVLLRAYVKRRSLHEKYFSHLTGVVMVSAKSTAAMALGGADFDGDLVKIISDKRIVQAVKKGNLDLNLPPIEIPSTKSKKHKLEQSIPLQVIFDTFSGKTGLISDLAVTLSRKEYSAEIVEERYKNACAKCTIVVGLEIDAAKSGNHPKENISEIETLAKEVLKSCGENIFLESKKIIRKIFKGHGSPIVDFDKGFFNLYFSKARRKVILKVPCEGENTPILERLVENYLRLIYERSLNFVANANDKSSGTQCFDFEVLNWRKTLDESLREKLGKLIQAYCDILSLAWKVQQIENHMREQNFSGYVINILKVQYDDYRRQKLSCGVEAETALKQLYSKLSDWLDTNAKIAEAIKALKDHKWHFTREEDRPTVAAKILGLNPDEKFPPFFELLYNFRCNGFGLFYFVLKDLEGLRFDKAESAKTVSNADSSADNPYYDEFYRIYSENIAAKKTKRIWNALLIKTCRQHLREIFGDDMHRALKYYWSQKSKDSSRKFLWEVFNEQEILAHVFTPQAQD